MTKSTPGSWTHYDDSKNPQHRHMIAAIGKTIAHIYCTKGMESEDAANARLIASAPDLLEALKDARSTLMMAFGDPEDAEDRGYGEDAEYLCYVRINAALAKAEPKP